MKRPFGRGPITRSLGDDDENSRILSGMILQVEILDHRLRMVMEPKYYAEEVIGHPNRDLRIWPLIPRALGRDIVFNS